MNNQHEIHIINVHELKEIRDAQPDICLIDVRELSEWQTVRIPGAIHIPKDQVADKIEAFVANKNQPVYLHCQAGKRSLDVANMLNDLGYTNLYSIQGGIGDWAMFGYPVER